VSCLQAPKEIGEQREYEDDQGVFALNGGPEGEGDADVSEAAGDGEAVCLDVGGGGYQGEDGEAEDRPERLQSLSRREEAHPPADEDRSSEVEGSVELEVDVLGVEEVVRAERGAEGGDGSGKKELPAEPQKAEGEEPEGGEQGERSEGEDGPRGSGGEGLDVGLGEHGSGEVVGGAEAEESGGAGFGGGEAELLLLCGEVGEMVGELGEAAADVAGSDAGAEQALA